MSQNPDVIVIGAGIVGAACAWRLASTGLTVEVFDRGAPGGEASQAALGVLGFHARPGAPATGRRVLAPLGRGWLRTPMAGGYLRAPGTCGFPRALPPVGSLASADAWSSGAPLSCGGRTTPLSCRLGPRRRRVGVEPHLCRADAGATHRAEGRATHAAHVVLTAENHAQSVVGLRA